MIKEEPKEETPPPSPKSEGFKEDEDDFAIPENIYEEADKKISEIKDVESAL